MKLPIAQTAAMRPRMMSALVAFSLAVAGGTVVAVVAGAGGGSSADARSVAGTEWTQYHGDRARSGHATSMPTYHGGLHVTKRITLDGAVYASPLVAAGLTVVATENDTVYAYNSANRLVWRRHLGAPARSSQLPCGNIHPLGITGTPVYYGKTGLVYVAAEFGGRRPTHRLYGLKIASGAVRFSRTLDLSGVDRVAMQERGALAFAHGRVWVPFGGLNGDCGAYKGRLVGYAATGTGAPISYTVPTTREAGIWAPPGPSVDRAANLFVAVGNGAAGVGDHYDYSDSVLRISSATARRADSFSPTTWASDNDADLDLGSQGPALVGNWIFTAGKSGTAYVLRHTRLGGIGGQVSKRSLCRSFGGTAVVGSVVYVPCTDGVRAVYLDPRGRMHVEWHAGSSITGSPVAGAGQVWTLDPSAGVLHVLDEHTGRPRAAVSVGVATRFATPALSGRRILVGTTSGLTVLSY